MFTSDVAERGGAKAKGKGAELFWLPPYPIRSCVKIREEANSFKLLGKKWKRRSSVFPHAKKLFMSPEESPSKEEMLLSAELPNHRSAGVRLPNGSPAFAQMNNERHLPHPTAIPSPFARSPSDEFSERNDHLFITDRMLRKRKAPSLQEIARPPKVLLTEATTGLDSLHISSPQNTPSPFNSPASKPPPPTTWAELHAAEMMEVEEPAARRVAPQLEMTESLKEAIRMAEMAEETAILPRSIQSQILAIPQEPCLAIVPYRPREEILALAESSSTRREAANHDASKSTDIEMES